MLNYTACNLVSWRLCMSVSTSNAAENYDSAAVITKRAIEEILAFTKVPRPTHYVDKVVEYLKAFADKHSFEFHRDTYGNVWMDVPATAGCEDYPKIILQGHTDMVCVSTDDLDIDFKTTGITPIVTEKTITADRTSLGADDSAGLGAMMAIAVSKCKHGPLRLLFTADEEDSLDGAIALDPAALDCDLLINLDSEKIGSVMCSSAGFLDYIASKTYTPQPVHPIEVSYEISVWNLKGGHSGDDIDKKRINAIEFLNRAFKRMYNRKIDMPIRFSAISAGTAHNVIASTAKIRFELKAPCLTYPTEDEAYRAVQETIRRYVEAYPDERIKWSFKHLDYEPDRMSLSVEDTKEIIDYVDEHFQGVKSMHPTIEGLPQTSHNLGVETLENGHFTFVNRYRSCSAEDLAQARQESESRAAKAGMKYTVKSSAPPWDGSPDDAIVQLAVKAFKEATEVPTKINASHGAVECANFMDKRPSLKIVSLGPDIRDFHSVHETLYLDSMEPLIKCLLYMLEHLNEL